MRGVLWLLATLVAVNAWLGYEVRAISRERAATAARVDELRARAATEEASSGARRELESLLQVARDSRGVRPLNIGALREELTRAEGGLDVRRLSLEFRPEDQAPPGMGASQVSASLRGSYEGLYAYLDRIEASQLPLSPQEISMRETFSDIVLDIRWTARWAVDAAPGQGAPIDSADVGRLHALIAREMAPRPGVDLFSPEWTEGEPFAAPGREVAPIEAEPPLAPSASPQAEAPLLRGFVLSRPELEPDPTRRVLAAIRFGEELKLARVGDVLGAYRVERIDPRESVTLVNLETGERLTLIH